MKFITCAVLLLASASPSAADDFFVPGDFPTIAAAGIAADVGDNIIVSPGTYGGFSIFGSNVRSSTGNPADVIVTGPAVIGAGGSLQSMTFAGGVEITTGEGRVTGCVIDGESLQIFGSGSDITMIESSLFRNCESSAIQMTDGLYAVEITDSEFINNNALSGNGGAIRMTDPGTLSIDGCTFLNNNSAFGTGGAIFAQADTMDLTVLFSTFINNGADEEAGAIYFAGAIFGGDLRVDSCVFDGNNAGIESNAGAIYAETRDVASAEVILCTFRNNAAGTFGGAVAGIPAGSGAQFMTVTQSDFCGSTPADFAGVIFGTLNTFSPQCPPDCVADTNGDGMLSPADFNGWILAFNNQTAQCDQNGDGFCTPADFNGWILNFNAGC